MATVQLLTVKDLAKRWKTNETSIRRYVADGIITPCKGVPGVKFHPKYIAELEEYKSKYESVKNVLASILFESSKVINL